MTWSPLACGIVSGKYDSGIPPYSRASLKVKSGWAGVGTGRAQVFRRGGALVLGRPSPGHCLRGDLGWVGGPGSGHGNLERLLA